jgi:hypothetical protein
MRSSMNSNMSGCDHMVYHYVLRVLKTSLWDPRCHPMFLKPKLHKESKNGFKTINYRRSPVMIFSKNCFCLKKIIIKIGRFVDF